MNPKLLAALAVGVALGAVGVAVGPGSGVEAPAAAPGSGGDDGLPVDIGDTLDTAVSSSEVDAAEYHRIVSAVRASRPELVDLLTRDVKPSDTVTAEVNLELGARPDVVQLVGPAETRFIVEDLAFEDSDDLTTIRVVARNTSPEAVRFTAFLHLHLQAAEP